MTTTKNLIKCCLQDELPDSMGIIADYFHIDKFNEEKFLILYGVYQEMIKYKGVDEKLLHNCLLDNRLNELIHKKFKYRPTDYYKMFCENNINIINDGIVFNNLKHIMIYSDDFCPKCLKKGYYTENNNIDTDCAKCLQLICKYCVSNNIDDEEDPICKFCN